MKIKIVLFLPIFLMILQIECMELVTLAPSSYIRDLANAAFDCNTTRFQRLFAQEPEEEKNARVSFLDHMGCYPDPWGDGVDYSQEISIDEQMRAFRGEVWDDELASKLMQTIQSYDGKDEEAKRLIEAYSHVGKIHFGLNKEVDDSFESPLTVAIKHGNIFAAELLLNNNSEQISFQDSYYQDSPLKIALQLDKKDIAQKILFHRTSVAQEKEILFDAINCSDNDAFLVRELVKKGANVNEVDPSKNTPLIWALKKNDLVVAKALALSLLPCPTIDVSACDSMGNSALHLAVKQQDCDVVALLLNVLKNKGINDWNQANQEGRRPLFIAVGKAIDAYKSMPSRGILPSKRSELEKLRENSIKIVKLLLFDGENFRQNIDVNQKNSEKNTLLYEAVQAEDSDLVRLLLQTNSSINEVGGSGWTPLHCAVYNNNSDIVELLLQHKDIDVNALGGIEKKPLQVQIHSDATGKKIAELLRAKSDTLLSVGEKQTLPPKSSTKETSVVQSSRNQLVMTFAKYFTMIGILGGVLYCGYQAIKNNYKINY